MKLGIRALFSLGLFLAPVAAVAQESVFAVDVSHWSGTITASEVACWKANGVEHVVPGTQVENITRQQLQAALDGGMSVDAYVVLYWDGDIDAQVRAALEMVRGFPIRRLWLDVEVYPAGRSVAQLESLVQEGLDACGGMDCGIYTAQWWWDAYMRGSTRFSHVPLWYAFYDNVPRLGTWSYQAFGGWPEPSGKQYTTGSLCGVTIDYNVMRVDTPPDGEPPPTPTGLVPTSGSVFTSGSVTMSVQSPTSADSYEFHLQYWDGAAWQEYYTYQPKTSSQTFWPAFTDTRYRFQVRARNAFGWSGWSSWSSFDFGQVGTVPSAPTPLSPADGAVITTSSVTLSVEPVSGASSYEFEIWYWGGTEWQYYYTYRPTGAQQTFWPAFDDTAYQWRARAENGFGWSDWSQWTGFDFGNVPRLPPAPQPSSPEDGATFASGSVTLAVEAVSGATGYDFEIGYWDGASWQYYYTYSPSSPSQTFWPAYGDTAYRWRARAENGFGTGDWSEWSHFDFGNVGRVPPAPTGLSPDDNAPITTSSVTLRADAVSGADRYEFEIYYWDGVEWSYYFAYQPSTNAQTFWPVYDDTFYLWRVRAENSYGWGAWSEDATFAFGNVDLPPDGGGDGTWAFPVGSAESGSGWFVSLGLGESWYSNFLGRWFRGHLGEDWFRSGGGTLGQPVYAAADGDVVTVLQNCGNYVDVVILKHDVGDIGEPVYTFYGHIESDGYVSEGDRVTKRQQIGVIGDPVDFNPHLHFEIKNETALINPPFSGCSNLTHGVYISAGYSGLANDYDGGSFYDPSDSTIGNRYYHPTRFVGERK